MVLLPHFYFDLAGMSRLNHPAIWQSVGMMVAVYGPGYWLIAMNPTRYGAFVWIGILGKTLGPIGFLIGAFRGELPWGFGVVCLTNDLIWWIPFWMFALKYAPLKSVLADEQSKARVD
jgi:small multidrug resistance pump